MASWYWQVGSFNPLSRLVTHLLVPWSTLHHSLVYHMHPKPACLGNEACGLSSSHPPHSIRLFQSNCVLPPTQDYWNSTEGPPVSCADWTIHQMRLQTGRAQPLLLPMGPKSEMPFSYAYLLLAGLEQMFSYPWFQGKRLCFIPRALYVTAFMADAHPSSEMLITVQLPVLWGSLSSFQGHFVGCSCWAIPMHSCPSPPPWSEGLPVLKRTTCYSELSEPE